MIVWAVVIAAVLALRPRRPARRRTQPVDSTLAGRLVLLGLRSGLSPHASLAEAARHAPAPTDAALRAAAHHVSVGGFDVAAEGADDLGPWLRVLGRATAIGAPVASELATHLNAVTGEAHQRRLAGAKSLPVRLALPLTLLVLPGVVLLTVGPSLLDTIAGLTDPGGLLP